MSKKSEIETRSLSPGLIHDEIALLQAQMQKQSAAQAQQNQQVEQPPASESTASDNTNQSKKEG